MRKHGNRQTFWLFCEMLLQCEKPEIEHGFCVIDYTCMYIFFGGFLAFIRTVERKQES